MNDYIIAIPSYKRSKKQETLQLLRKNGFSKSKIYIFVQTEEDYKEYYRLYSSLCNIIHVKAGSISEARNNILNYFNNKENLLMMDDDISGIFYGSKEKKLIEIKGSDLKKTFENMFEYNKRNHGYLFGLYPVCNNFFMSESVSSRVTVNTVIGIPRGFSYRFDESFIAKEDIELCGRILNQGGRILRFNNVAHKAKHRTNKGGANDVWKTNENQKAALRLCKMYSSIFSTQKNKTQEVRMQIKDIKLKGVNLWK